MNRLKYYIAALLCLGLVRVAQAGTPPSTAPARPVMTYPDYSTPRRAVETFIWAVKAHDSDKISACLYGRTKLEKSAADAFAQMTAAMGSMLATAKKQLGPPPGHARSPSVGAQLNALKAALMHSTVSIQGDHAVIGFARLKGKTTQGPLHLVKCGSKWKLDIQYMLHLRQTELTHKLISHRVADELTFAHVLRSVTADVNSGKIKTWQQFTVDFESRMLAVTARKEAKEEAARKASKPN